MVFVLIAARLSMAWAASVEVRASVGAADTVIAVVRTADAAQAARCNDAGAPPDGVADGIWTCGAIEVGADAADVLLVVDGHLTDAGVLSWSGTGARYAAVSLVGGAVSAATDPRVLTATGGAAPAPGGPIALARVLGYGATGAPVVTIGSAQLFCHDDGQFPDAGINDGSPGCAARLDATSGPVVLRSGDGTSTDLGTVTWPDGPIRFLTIDVAARTASVEPFDLPLPPLPALPSADAAPADAPPADAAPADAAPADGAPADAASPPSPAASPAPQPAGPQIRLSAEGSALFTPWPYLVLLVGVGGGVLALRLRGRRAPRLQRMLRRHPAPPLLPGGPQQGQAALLRADDPLALAEHLLPVLAQGHRVVLVLPAPAALPPVGGAGAWVAVVPTWDEVALGASELAATPGAPVALLVVGGATMTDPGSVTPDAIGKLSRALPPGVGMTVVAQTDEPVASWLPAYRVSAEPWTAAPL